MPAEVEITDANTARSAFSSSSALSVQSVGTTSLVLSAGAKIPVGDHRIAFGGVRNPASFAPTGLFSMQSRDEKGNVIAGGLNPGDGGEIDNVEMSQRFQFTKLSVEADNKTNGATTAYTVAFVPGLKLESEDHFIITLPTTISAPKEPQCEALACVAAVTCISEQDRVIARLSGPRCGS